MTDVAVAHAHRPIVDGIEETLIAILLAAMT